MPGKVLYNTFICLFLGRHRLCYARLRGPAYGLSVDSLFSSLFLTSPLPSSCISFIINYKLFITIYQGSVRTLFVPLASRPSSPLCFSPSEFVPNTSQWPGSFTCHGVLKASPIIRSICVSPPIARVRWYITQKSYIGQKSPHFTFIHYFNHKLSKMTLKMDLDATFTPYSIPRYVRQVEKWI